jgi:hypothetical protein
MRLYPPGAYEGSCLFSQDTLTGRSRVQRRLLFLVAFVACDSLWYGKFNTMPELPFALSQNRLHYDVLFDASRNLRWLITVVIR